MESDEVAFLFSPLGTPGISATIKYVNAKKVPHLFVVSGVTRFANFAEFPMITLRRLRRHFFTSGQSLASSGLAASSGEMVATSL